MTTLAVDDLESLLEGTIHCQDCPNPAEFVSSGHRCPAFADRPFFKCHPCYRQWRNDVEATIAIHRHVRCPRLLYPLHHR